MPPSKRYRTHLANYRFLVVRDDHELLLVVGVDNNARGPALAGLSRSALVAGSAHAAIVVEALRTDGGAATGPMRPNRVAPTACIASAEAATWPTGTASKVVTFRANRRAIVAPASLYLG